jgi:hypothetical protein
VSAGAPTGRDARSASPPAPRATPSPAGDSPAPAAASAPPSAARPWTVARRAGPADRRDALLWLIGLLLVGCLPIGRVSGDGLGYASRIAAGGWTWNPNHLLLDPAGALWHRLLLPLGSTRPIVDELELLSVAAGALAAGWFRWAVAPRLAERRWAANHATAWLVLASASARLLVADEFHMIRMPCLVALALALLRYLERPSFPRALAAGAAAGVAALCFVADGLLGLTAALALGAAYLWRPGRPERHAALHAAAGIVLGLVLVTAPALGGAWWHVRPGEPLPAWLASYAGGAAPPRSSQVYGTRATPAGVAAAAVRTLYGAASAAVDLAPAVAAARDYGAPGRAALVAIAWLLAAAALGGGLWHALRHRDEPAARGALLLQAVWWPAILGFGLYWNDSKDQFFFQLAVPFAALAAHLPARGRGAPLLLLCSAAALAWNAGDVLHRFILYPRAELTAALAREVEGACLIVVPGYDDAAVLLAQAGRDVPARRLSLTELAVAWPPQEGLRRLAAAAGQCLAAGRRVDLIDVVDVPPRRAPWKFLRGLGYDRWTVQRALAPFPMDSQARRAGPFSLRSLRPGPPRPEQ